MHHAGKSRPKAGAAPLSAEERALFRDQVGGVTPVPQTTRAPQRALPSARPRMREADEAAVMAEIFDTAPPDPDLETGDELLHRQAGVQHSVVRRLRRGHYRCQAEIDLHGMVVAVARRCLAEFLHESLARGYRCVRVVHGKGLRSGHRGPVLKAKVAHWLRQRAEVLAYSSARPTDGGTGALYVLLRKSR